MGIFEAQNIEPRKYIGRPFKYGTSDCCSLLIEFYEKELGIVIPKVHNVEGWWEEGENLYVDNIAASGFEEVVDIQIYDVILIKLMSSVPNHAAIYLGDGNILHHVTGRLSSIVPLTGFWLKNISIIARYKV